MKKSMIIIIVILTLISSTNIVIANELKEKTRDACIESIIQLPDYHYNDGVYSQEGYYDSSQEKTYVVYQDNSEEDLYIKSYDHTLGEWRNSHFVCKAGVHYPQCPYFTIVKDDENYIHILIGVHNGQAKIIKSSNSNNITSWETAKNVGPSTTSNQILHYTNEGVMYIFYRKGEGYGNRPYYSKKSVDDGESWSS